MKLITTSIHDFIGGFSTSTYLFWSLGLILSISCLFTSCSSPAEDQVQKEVRLYQQGIDSLLTNLIAQRKAQLQEEIQKQLNEGKDTFALAKKLVPLNKLDFLLASQYDYLDTLLINYEYGIIEAESVKSGLKTSKHYIDSLMNVYQDSVLTAPIQ